MNENEIKINSAWDYWDEYAFWSDVIYKIPELTHNIRPQTNQMFNDETYSGCTIVWTVNQLIRLFWLNLTSKQQDELCVEVVKYCTQFWYVPWKGWSTVTAINSVSKFWNEIWYKTFNTEKIFYSRVTWWDSRIHEALDKWHLVWFTYQLNWNSDKYVWLVYKDSYPAWKWHRTNIKAPKFVEHRTGYKTNEANEWVHDNFYTYTNEYYIKDIGKYVNKGVYPAFYIILPRSCMIWTVEEQKQRIALLKAVNAVIAVLTSTWWDLPEEYQELSASYAKALREQYPEARKLEENQLKKVSQSVVDLLSYTWKFFDSEDQKKLAELAWFLRKKHNIQ